MVYAATGRDAFQFTDRGLHSSGFAQSTLALQQQQHNDGIQRHDARTHHFRQEINKYVTHGTPLCFQMRGTFDMRRIARIVSETEIENGRLSLALRPELLSLNGHAPSENQLTGRVETIAFLGSIVRIQVRLKENSLLLDEFNNPHLTLPAIGDTVVLSFQREACLVLQP